MEDIQNTIKELRIHVKQIKDTVIHLEREAAFYEAEAAYLQEEGMNAMWCLRHAKTYRDESAFYTSEFKRYLALLKNAEDDRYLYHFWDERIA